MFRDDLKHTSQANLISVILQKRKRGPYAGIPLNRKIHGETGTSLYRRWQHMIGRCENASDARFEHYGGRGITVCEEWHDYLVFREWALANGYEKHLTIERINVNGNYEPPNCCWATWAEQARNKTSNRMVSQYSKDGELITTYNTISEAKEATGTVQANIIKVCKGERPYANGFIWKYAN